MPPTFSPAVHNVIFALAGIVAVSLSVWCYVEYRAHERAWMKGGRGR